ncbi:hypothetical protein Tcan_00738, partial [Toxocara canis]
FFKNYPAYPNSFPSESSENRFRRTRRVSNLLRYVCERIVGMEKMQDNSNNLLLSPMEYANGCAHTVSVFQRCFYSVVIMLLMFKLEILICFDILHTAGRAQNYKMMGGKKVWRRRPWCTASVHFPANSSAVHSE